MGELWKRFPTFLIIYGVSGTFFWPGIAALFLWKLHGLVGGWIGHASILLIVGLYTKVSYGQRYEKRFGNAWLRLNKWWPVSHDYFPVRLWIWDGKSCTCQPSKAHQTALPDKYILTLHPHGKLHKQIFYKDPPLKLYSYLFDITYAYIFSQVHFHYQHQFSCHSWRNLDIHWVICSRK